MIAEPLVPVILPIGNVSGAFAPDPCFSNEQSKRKAQRQTHRAPNGTLFLFNDGFRCYALNQKSANKKHERFLNDKKI